MWEPDRSEVLGGGLRGARDRLDGSVPWGLGAPAGACERVLQRGKLWAVRAARGADGSGAGYDGQREIRAVRADIPTR